ncbi:MAG TPA: 16S rRNA (adenine(1518)-N(6)/adenine(1519)-N(6))-dimethyltransferase RsmA [Anaerolineales bacterium]|jgi:16S rRNA (adenine1518-N6/adenine1519-N6)-dimethyltransferase|nr:16S rRNA (adenine(1518)-N(6)/adenine(1519)-N(6))-dimethyltransferase RsmA [Anaerolineales bacterium]
MSSYQSIPALLKRYGLKPQKGLGQNFLSDPGSLQKVIRAADIQPEDTVLEIGPGLGSLTHLIAQAASRVIAVELDIHLVGALEDILQPYPHVELIQADILEVNLNKLFSRPGYLVVANIPYYITSALLRQLLEAEHPPARLVLTIQKEVAERICAEAGDLSLLALSVQVYGQPEIIDTIPAGAFYPVPNVDSAVVRVEIFPEPRIPREHLDMFFSLIKAGFSQKRKTITNAISAGMRWDKGETAALLVRSSLDPKRRAQTLSLEEWKRLVEVAVTTV